MLTRREALALAGGLSLLPAACRKANRSSVPVTLNDIHSQLNSTRVARVDRPASLGELESIVRAASRSGSPLSIAGGRHSMGGQQFGTDTINLDMRALDRVLGFDSDRGTIEVEAGIQWPQLVSKTHELQEEGKIRWGIRQKQTGADRLTLGGALASNIHGRGLQRPPIAADVESLILMGPTGELHRCSRQENGNLFSLVLGGYGCFGVVYSLVLRLAPRQPIQRVVETRGIERLDRAFESRIADGFLFGDFQFKTDETAGDFLQTGVFSCYRPITSRDSTPESQKRLSRAKWSKLLELAHVDKGRAYEAYSSYYQSTDGQIYGSDTHQLSPYLDGYHEDLDRRIGLRVRGSEMISEVYVPRNRLAEFMILAAGAFRRAEVNVIYGTIRLIERDDLTFLAWAREPWACIVFNFHVDHSNEGIAKAQDQFRLLIDLAVDHGGSYFLTYHRWATREQVQTCYPQMLDFLRRKLSWDPDERFQSDWYRHYRHMFSESL
jgi:FAD/FMN-containing dehydrogenase